MDQQIELEVVRLHRFDDSESKLKAFVDISIGEFIVRGLRIVNGQNGLYVAMPQEQGKDGRWYSCFYPKSKQARNLLTDVVLDAYLQ